MGRPSNRRGQFADLASCEFSAILTPRAEQT
jgi:hypothetical protein